MKNTLTKLFIFAAGAVVGSAVTWKFVEEKYKQIAQEEIDSVKEAFGITRETKDSAEDDIAEDYIENTDGNSASFTETDQYKELLKHQGYINYSNDKGGDNMDRPYVISPEEFGELDDYEQISLTYYDDKVLTDDFGNIIEDVDSLIGIDSLTHFGEYEDDSVFVRNDRTKCDYEILLDVRKYSEIS